MNRTGHRAEAPPHSAGALEKAAELVEGLMFARAPPESTKLAAYFGVALFHVFTWTSVGLAATGDPASRWLGLTADCLAFILVVLCWDSKGAEKAWAHFWVDAASAVRIVADVRPAWTRRLVVVATEHDTRPDADGHASSRVIRKNPVVLTGLRSRRPPPTAGGAAAAGLAATLRTAHGSRDREQPAQGGGASARPQVLPRTSLATGTVGSVPGDRSSSGIGSIGVGSGGGVGGCDGDGSDGDSGGGDGDGDGSGCVFARVCSPPQPAATQLSVHELLAWGDTHTQDAVTAAVAVALTRAGYRCNPDVRRYWGATLDVQPLLACIFVSVAPPGVWRRAAAVRHGNAFWAAWAVTLAGCASGGWRPARRGTR